jgi:hypothetical protein
VRPDYCPIGGEPCQSVCADPCTVKPKDHGVIETTNRRPGAEACGSAPAWRLLTRGEPIQMGDEGLQDDCTTWLPVVGWEVGMSYNPGFLVPMRRRA